MKIIIKVIILSFVVSFTALQAQQNDTLQSINDTVDNELITALERADLSFLWAGEESQDSRIGFMGENFQRLQLRFLSVIKNYDNPFEYFVYGKTKIEKNICEFQGSLLITETGYIQDKDYPNLQRGYISGDYVFFEDQLCISAGVFRGNFFTSFYIDDEGTFYYDDLEEDTEYFSNNEFWGEWSNYRNDQVKIANWGDHRIPESDGLDVGEKEFHPSFQYLKFGWESYLQERKEKDAENETEQWWE